MRNFYAGDICSNQMLSVFICLKIKHVAVYDIRYAYRNIVLLSVFFCVAAQITNI